MGGYLYNFVTGDRFVNPGQNLACPKGGFSVWTGLQVAEDVREVIAASATDMVTLYRRNATENQIFRAARVVLRFLVGPLTTQQDLGTCCYLLHCLLGPR